MSSETVNLQLPSHLAKTILNLTPSDGGPRAELSSGEGERYEERGVLGAGGMGEVRLGEDQRLGREVAIKVIRAGTGASAEARLRFLREARIQGQLEHPSIVPVYDLDVSESGDAFFTMKRVRGVTLEAVIEGLKAGDEKLTRKHSRRRLLTAFTSVCLSVDFAHDRGVIHRDLKPSNIMLGDFGEVYVLDWGIAKVKGMPESERGSASFAIVQSPPTAAGSVLGTAGYMPPEQLQSEPIDERADVYALGAILFELLAWEPLHPGDTVGAIVKSTGLGADARVSSRAPQREVPPELEAICVRATATDPAARFNDARELAEAVDRFLDGDRDLEKRRTMAETHARAAEEVLSADDASLEPRRAAMQEVGKALAFDPLHAGARATFVRLLATLPREMPAEANADYDRARMREERVGAKLGVASYSAWLAFGALLLILGVRDWTAFAVFMGGQALAIAACVWRVYSEKPGGAAFVVVRSAVFLATVSMSAVFGPLLLVPTVATSVTVSVLLHPCKQPRALMLIGGCATVIAPLALQWAGVLPASYAFAGGAMTIRPWMTVFPEGATLIAILLASVGTIVMSAILIMRVRDDLTAAESRLSIQAWHLRQLVP